MNLERARALLLTLPHAAETLQWGETLVFWVGSKAQGGRIFAILPLDVTPGSGQPLISFAAGPERFPELLELDGVHPAPYLARAHWVAVTGWVVFRDSEWREHLQHAHTVILGKMTARTRARITGASPGPPTKPGTNPDSTARATRSKPEAAAPPRKKAAAAPAKRRPGQPSAAKRTR